MDEYKWKKENKLAACTRNPLEPLIPYDIRFETLRRIKQECIEAYGEDISSECSKRKVCFSKQCMGRELPWKSKTAEPYLKELEKTHNIVDGKLIVSTDCSSCPIYKDCTTPCFQITDFLQRSKTQEPIMVSKEDTTNLQNKVTETIKNTLGEVDIPWDVLSDRRKKVIELYLGTRIDFKTVAEKLGLNNQARAKYEYYAALTTISEYTVVRKFLSEKYWDLTDRQRDLLNYIYVENKSISQAAILVGVTKQSAAQTVARVFDNFEVKWPKFVRKEKGKVIYNVPQVLK